MLSLFLFRRHILLIAFNIVARGCLLNHHCARSKASRALGPLCCSAPSPSDGAVAVTGTTIILCVSSHHPVQIEFTYRIITLFQSGQMSVIVSLSREPFIICVLPVHNDSPKTHTCDMCNTLWDICQPFSQHI